jgi:hypothetical protein
MPVPHFRDMIILLAVRRSIFPKSITFSKKIIFAYSVEYQ